jgi:hypothetical protein
MRMRYVIVHVNTQVSLLPNSPRQGTTYDVREYCRSRDSNDGIEHSVGGAVALVVVDKRGLFQPHVDRNLV